MKSHQCNVIESKDMARFYTSLLCVLTLLDLSYKKYLLSGEMDFMKLIRWKFVDVHVIMKSLN